MRTKYGVIYGTHWVPRTYFILLGVFRFFLSLQLAWKEIGMMKFLTLTLYLFARITLTLISSSPVTGCFQKFN